MSGQGDETPRGLSPHFLYSEGFMTANATNLYREGNLSGAITALTDAVKKQPTDEVSRALLAEMLFFEGKFDRADTQLNAISNLHPEKAVTIALWRQLVRGAVARDQLFAEGRVPEFLSPPGEHVQLLLRAMVAMRDGNADEAVSLLAQVEEMRPPVSGRMDGTSFTDMRDLDDMFAPVMEVFTSTGKYYWVPLETIEIVTFDAPARPSDLCWRQASMTVRGGADGIVYVPAIYPALPGEDTREDGLKLGRATDWVEAPEGVYRGRGQRCFLIGDDDVPIMNLTTLEFHGPN